VGVWKRGGSTRRWHRDGMDGTSETLVPSLPSSRPSRSVSEVRPQHLRRKRPSQFDQQAATPAIEARSRQTFFSFRAKEPWQPQHRLNWRLLVGLTGATPGSPVPFRLGEWRIGGSSPLLWYRRRTRGHAKDRFRLLLRDLRLLAADRPPLSVVRR